jgi:hypothetical protein
MRDQSNTRNPATTVIRTKSQPFVYTRDDFTRDLGKVAKKRPRTVPKK